MNATDFTTTISVKNTPLQVFNAINNVRGWWSEQIEGPTDKLTEVFVYHYRDVHYCKIKVTELIPGKRVAWKVLDNRFSFIADKEEWVGTVIGFDISEKDGHTEIVFTHHGLTPVYECFEVCNEAWTNYIQNSLRDLITTGKGSPNPREGDGYNTELAKKFNIEQ